MSYTTGRYVPMYQNREIDDPRWPKRIYPPIPDLVMGQGDDETIEVIDGVEIVDPAVVRQRRGTGTAWYPAVGPGWQGVQ